MSVYQTTGVLTGHIKAENIGAANDYLHEPKMAEYVAANANLEGLLVWLVWDLAADGHAYTITAVTTRDLDDDELQRLSDECSGQNSDGHGEGFEQQEFAWDEEAVEPRDCDNCQGSGEVSSGSDDEIKACGECGGDGSFDDGDDGRMISFDWETNKLPWTKIK